MNAVVFDPTLQGQPLSRPRRRLTASFGAEDLAAQQRDRAQQLRAHRALLHGAGTLWGLVATAAAAGASGRRTRVLVSPGLAVDAFGRELNVEREQSLDVTSLVHHAIWAELAGPDPTAAGTVRRAYIVLRHEGPPEDLGAQVMASQGGRGAEAQARPPERFRLELSATPPEGPRALQRDCVSALVAQDTYTAPDLRLAFLLQEAPPAAPALAVRSEVAALLLATVDLDVTGTGAAATAFVVEPTPSAPNPDNHVRAVVPDAGRVAEVLFGDRLPPRAAPRR